MVAAAVGSINCSSLLVFTGRGIVLLRGGNICDTFGCGRHAKSAAVASIKFMGDSFSRRG